ncbi:MAG: hypothetical protein ACI8O8_000176 [Oleiphilaceae bacterium]|jgi:hypothetical protein
MNFYNEIASQWETQKDDIGSIVNSADEGMTWNVNAQGNLEIEITSSSKIHQIVLANFDDSYRPQVVVSNPHDAIDQHYSERMVSEATYQFEVANRVSLVNEPLDDTSFTFINKDTNSTEVEVMTLNAAGSWEWQIDGVQDETATLIVDTTENYISLDFGDGADTLAIEDIYADSNDFDGDSDTTENIYLFTCWYKIDATTGLGSCFRDEFYKN